MLRVLNLSLTGSPVPVCREPSIFFRVCHFALAGWTGPVYREPPIFSGVFHSALAGWTRPIPREASIAFFILDAPLTRRPLAVLGQTSVLRRILNASMASRSHFGTGGCSDRLFAHCSRGILRHVQNGNRGAISSSLIGDVVASDAEGETSILNSLQLRP